MDEDIDALYERGDHDERDAEEQIGDPKPVRSSAPFLNPDITAKPTAMPTTQRIMVVNRALPDEAVPNCRVSIGTVAGATNQFGAVALDLTPLTDGQYSLLVVAPDVSDDSVGPGSPADTTKERIWRRFAGTVQVQGGRVITSSPKDGTQISGGELRVAIVPIWLRSKKHSSRSSAPDMIVIHHTAGNLQGDLREFLYSNRVSIHYLVAPDGAVYKIVDEARSAAHAGYSHWQGQENLNGRSIGIELTHKTGVEYPLAQIDAVVELMRRLKLAYPNITAGRVIGHSDIGICEPASPNPCSPAKPKRLGRKSTDPGSAFPWERIEALGLSFQYAEGSIAKEIFGGFFMAVPNGRLQRGDNDALKRFGGKIRSDVSDAVRELQEDLAHIGYFCPPDGDYGKITSMAVQMFQQHVFSGSRRTGDPDQFNSGDGTLDLSTAHFIKRTLGQVGGPVA